MFPPEIGGAPCLWAFHQNPTNAHDIHGENTALVFVGVYNTQVAVGCLLFVGFTWFHNSIADRARNPQRSKEAPQRREGNVNRSEGIAPKACFVWKAPLNVEQPMVLAF